MSIKVARNIYFERMKLFYGVDRSKEFIVIAEGSELQINDNGIVKYFQNDLSHKVPLYFRPLLITT